MKTATTDRDTLLKTIRNDPFIRAFVECLLWSEIIYPNPENDDESYPADQEHDIADIDTDGLREIVSDCQSFWKANQRLIERRGACLTRYEPAEQAGHDFCLNRNGHGCGFWETSDWRADIGSKLDIASETFGTLGLYIGDDGILYVHH